MNETFWQQVQRFPHWKQHEWIGMGMMYVGFLHVLIAMGIFIR